MDYTPRYSSAQSTPPWNRLSVPSSLGKFMVGDVDLLNGRNLIPNDTYPIPWASHVVVYASARYSAGAAPASPYDTSIELALAVSPAQKDATVPYNPFLGGSYVSVGWLWGTGFEAQTVSPQTADPNIPFVMAVTCPRGKYNLWARIGMNPAITDPTTVVTVSAEVLYLDGLIPNSDRISDLCSMPPFRPDGTFLFSHITNGCPLFQTSQMPRRWRSKKLTNASFLKSLFIVDRLKGGPWYARVLANCATANNNPTVYIYGDDRVFGSPSPIVIPPPVVPPTTAPQLEPPVSGPTVVVASRFPTDEPTVVLANETQSTISVNHQIQCWWP